MRSVAKERSRPGDRQYKPQEHAAVHPAHERTQHDHTAMQALFTAWYNFGRNHDALKGNTQAMASGLSDHVWTIEELIEKAAVQ